MAVLGLEIAVLRLSLILFMKSEFFCRRLAPVSNSKINNKSSGNPGRLLKK